jgi:hypothetical protein
MFERYTFEAPVKQRQYVPWERNWKKINFENQPLKKVISMKAVTTSKVANHSKIFNEWALLWRRYYS